MYEDARALRCELALLIPPDTYHFRDDGLRGSDFRLPDFDACDVVLCHVYKFFKVRNLTAYRLVLCHVYEILQCPQNVVLSCIRVVMIKSFAQKEARVS